MRQLKLKNPALEVRWRAFELRPEPAPLPNPRDEYRQMAWIRSVHPMAAKLGVTMRMPSIAPRTRLAHEAAAWARAQGKADAMTDAIFRAYFEKSLDIGNADVLVKLASNIGLDSTALSSSLAGHSHLQEVLDDESLAQTYGLSGVPAFIWNGHGIVGVQTEKALMGLLQE